jgi:hypothetical protein
MLPSGCEPDTRYLQTMANRGYNPLVAIQLALSGQCNPCAGFFASEPMLYSMGGMKFTESEDTLSRRNEIGHIRAGLTERQEFVPDRMNFLQFRMRICGEIA